VAVLSEDAADEQAAVAVGWVFFSAKECDAKALDAGLKAVNSDQEASVFAETAVEDMSRCVVIGWIGGSAA